MIQRIMQIIDYKDINKSRFYKETGLSNGFLDKVKDVGSSKLEDILRAYPEISPEWLLTGDGDMLRDENLPTISNSKGVPYYDVDFIGGFDLVLNDQTVNPNFYINFEPFNDADFWVNITGKSMSPFISHGDIVALQKFDGWQDFLLYGEIYAIVTDHFRTIKIVGKGETNDEFTLIPYSKSPEFSKQPIPKRLIRNMFKVKGSIKKFF